VAVDSAGNVYVADTFNDTIRKVTPIGTNWVVTTLAGLAGSPGSADGTGSDARFSQPRGVAVDSTGNIYVTDTENHTIRKVTPVGTNWVVTTLAGLPGSSGSTDGTGNAARFGTVIGGPLGVAVDSAGNVYVSDAYPNSTIRKVTPTGVVTTLAGLADAFVRSADGTGSAARFDSPFGVAVDSAGNVYVEDINTIRKGSPVPMGFLLFGPRMGFNGGPFGLFLTGPAGQSVVVEVSTDLVNWLPLWTNTFAGALNFVDSQSGAYSNRFYRALMPQPAAGTR
jgi:sugar lactone lactonase YvrE